MERDFRARKAAASLLPNPVPPSRERHDHEWWGGNIGTYGRYVWRHGGSGVDGTDFDGSDGTDGSDGVGQDENRHHGISDVDSAARGSQYRNDSDTPSPYSSEVSDELSGEISPNLKNEVSECDDEINRSGPSIDDDDIDDDIPVEKRTKMQQKKKSSAFHVEGSTKEERIHYILQLLGPAVTPAQCALRRTSPVTKGPIRNRLLPTNFLSNSRNINNEHAPTHSKTATYADSNYYFNSAFLLGVSKAHTYYLEKLDDEFLSMESGRSRFSRFRKNGEDIAWKEDELALLRNIVMHDELDVENDCMSKDGLSHVDDGCDQHDTSFGKTMMALYLHPNSSSNVSNSNAEKGKRSHSEGNACSDKKRHTSNSSLHISNHLISKPIHLRHEPADLTKIYGFKKIRFKDASNYSETVLSSLPPRIRASGMDNHRLIFTSHDGMVLVGEKKTATKESTVDGFSPWQGPHLDSLAATISRKDDNESLGRSATFERFYENISCDNDGDSEIQLPSSQILASLDARNDEGSHLIRLDPDIELINQKTPGRRKKSLRELSKSLNVSFSAKSILEQFHLPIRFEVAHDISEDISRFHIPNNEHRFEFSDKLMKDFKDEQSLNNRPAFLERVLQCDSQDMPRRIVLESDMHPAPDDGSDKCKTGRYPTANSLLLKLPSFSECVSFARRKDHYSCSQLGRNAQMSFVKSSIPVNSLSALHNVIEPARGTCLFLPQINLQASFRKQERKSPEGGSSSDQLISAIRACIGPNKRSYDDIELLKAQSSPYPVASWFNCDSVSHFDLHPNSGAKSNNPMSLQNRPTSERTFIDLTRQNFCGEAKIRSTAESFRRVILTGCSARKNAASKYSYRGFLTNQAVDPKVFQARYYSMVRMDKLCRKSKDVQMVGMVWNTFVDASMQQKTTGGTMRGAPHSIRMRTKRHGQMQLNPSRNSNTTKPMLLADESREYRLISSKVDNLSSYFHNQLTNDPDRAFSRKPYDATLDVESLGKDAVRVRGELLHLVSKLEEEEQTIFEELAVVNRGNWNSPESTPFDDRCEIDDHPHDDSDLLDVDMTLTTNDQPVEERKDTSDEMEINEHQHKKKKKKRKKENKKHKKKHKKHRTRKGRNDPVSDVEADCLDPNSKKHRVDSSENSNEKKHGHDGSNHQNTKERNDPATEDENECFDPKKDYRVSSSENWDENKHGPEDPSHQNMRVAVPDIPLGMTPINPPKEKEKPSESDAVHEAEEKYEEEDNPTPVLNIFESSEKSILESDGGIPRNNHDSTFSSSSNCGSPDSFNSGRKQLFPVNDGNDEHAQGQEVRRKGKGIGKDAVLLPECIVHIGSFPSVSTQQCSRSSNEQDFGLSLSETIGSTFIAENEDISQSQEEQQTGDEGNREVSGHPYRSSNKKNAKCQRNESPLTLLTSERFLERNPTFIADIVSGRWQSTLTAAEMSEVNNSAKDAIYEVNGIELDLSESRATKINICDCPLLDIADVDIELADNSAIIVESLSNWSDENQGSRSFIRKLVSLAATARYSAIHVILCLDDDLSSDTSNEIVTLQNALIQQSGCPCDDVSFEFVSPRVVAASIALRLINAGHESNWIANLVADENALERARFLLMLVPTMSVHMAYKCICGEPSKEFQKLFCMASTGSLHHDRISKQASEQFCMAVNVELSHAHLH